MAIDDPSSVAHALRELIAALDRRMPHVEQAGEEAITRDAAMLRAKATKRLAELGDFTGDEPAPAAEKAQGAGGKR